MQLSSLLSQTLSWEHYILLRQRNFEGVDGIGKRFLVDGKLAFSMEMHPRSGIQSLQDRDSEQLLRYVLGDTSKQ